MSERYALFCLCKTMCLFLTLGVSMNAYGFGGDSWKEEVLLHDGSTLTVTRSQSYGGQHEIGQPLPIKEHTISFMLPNTRETITWTSEYGEDIGRTNFYLLAVHTLNGMPYIVASPNSCQSYNKWGRPNPPYVFFKYDDTAWQRIPLGEFPAEFTTINVALDILGREVKNLVSLRDVSSEKIKELNHHTTIPEYRIILREPVNRGSLGSSVNCEEMIRYKCGWISPQGTFGRNFMDKTCK